MKRLKRFIHEIHRRSLWQVLLIYCGAALVAYQAVQALTEGLGLPQWFPALAIVLFIVGLPIVLATAFVHEVAPPTMKPAEPTALTEAEAARIEAEAAAVHLEARRRHRFLTWRNAVAGFVIVLAVWGVVATGWLVLHESGATPPSGKSVAVLPFVNMSVDPENEYFSDGITDAIITHLTKIADLQVTSRTSSMQYKGADKSLLDIAAELGVTTIVEGSVQQTGERVRVNAQLIDAQSDEHLWAEIYDRDLTDIFAVQSDIAQQIATALRATLTPDERERIEQEPTENLAAYDSYLLGRLHWNKRTVEGFRTAIEHFRRAIEGDPEYALAYTGIADSYALLAGYDAVSPKDVLPAARAAALRALEIDNSLGEAYASLGLIKLFEWDWPGAEVAFQRAVELNPGYATAHHWYAFYFMAVARLGEALAELERAQELDPLSVIITVEVGFPLYLNGQYDRAIEEFRKALVLDRDFAPAYAWLGLAYAEQGKFDEAITACQEAVALSGRLPLYVAYLAYVNAAAGRSAGAMSLVRELEERASSEYISPALFVPVYSELGDTDRALEWLERAYREHSWYLIRVNVDPKLDALRSEMRFSSLLGKVGLE